MQKKLSVLKSFFNKVADLKVCSFINREAPTQVFTCEYREIFKNSLFYGTSLVAASVGWKKIDLS